MNIQLSSDQEFVLGELLKWYPAAQASGYITVGGYAGTGKSTLISVLRKELHRMNPQLKVAFASYTGKAARVLQQKIEETNATYPKDTVGTIHSLIYGPIVNSQQEIVGWLPKEKIQYDLIIIDEASMIDAKIWRDLTAYGKPIIAVGDHGQLPPISGNFSLMQKPTYTLEEIHRQAKENPIIQLSIAARTTGEVLAGRYGQGVKKISRTDQDAGEFYQELLQGYKPDTLMLCGFNATRVRVNGQIRNILGFDLPLPQRGDRVICLRNNHGKRIYNGMQGTVVSITDIDTQWYDAEIKMDGQKNLYQGKISTMQFGSNTPMNFTQNRSIIMQGDLFDFGYALTVHKAQGSQARKVVLFEERSKHMDDEMWRRWLYTAVTRAEEELYIIG
jgi:exodeoxyribonuclease-5